MTDSNAKGTRNERELMNYLAERDWVVIRAPASGSATSRDLPDVLAGKRGVFVAIEAKRSSDDVIYIDEHEVVDLVRFATEFGAVPQLSVRFDEKPGDPSYGEDYPGHYIIRPQDCFQTRGGNFRVKKEKAITEGVPVFAEDFFDHMEYDHMEALDREGV